MKLRKEPPAPAAREHQTASSVFAPRSRMAKAVSALTASAVLSIGLLAGCSSSTSQQESTEPELQTHMVTFDAGEAQSQFGIQNADALPYGREFAPGDIVDIPDISGGDYNVFIPGYTLTGWQRSDTGEVIPVEQASSSEENSSQSSNQQTASADDPAVEAEGVSVTEETPDGDVTAEAVEVESTDPDNASSGAADDASEDTSTNTADATAAASDEASNASSASSFAGSDDDAVAEFIMPDDNVTLTAQWTPLTVDVYAADGEDAEPTYVATVDLSGAGIQGSAEDTSAWLSYNTFNQGEARVFTSAYYFPLEAVFEQAGITVDPTDTVILGEDVVSGDPEQSDMVEHDWEYYLNGMFYPNTTCDTYSLDSAEAVTPSLSLSYKEGRSSSKTELLSAIADRSLTEGIAEQSAEMCPRALFGVPTASYDQNTGYSGSQHPYGVNQILVIR